MATYETVVRLQLDNKQAVQRAGQLRAETKRLNDEARKLTAQLAQQAVVSKEDAEALGVLRAQIRRNQAEMRELDNAISGTTAAGLRFRDKMADATKNALIPFGGVVGLVTVGVAAAAHGVIELTRELNDLSGQIQAQDRKAQIVFGDALGYVTEAAEANALAMGLTEREYTNAAAGVQDLLVPLGFARDEAARNAVEVTNLAGALSLWSGGQVNASEAASRLQKGLLGETESLKELGIVIDQSSKEYNERIKLLMEAEGLTKAQARALDILGQVQQQTTDAQTNYSDGTESLIVQQAKANAELRQAKEELAEGLTPAFISATRAQANFTSGMALATKETSTFNERIAGLISTALGPAGKAFRTIISAVYGQWEATELAGLSVEELEKRYDRAIKTAEMYRQKGQEIKAVSYEAEAAKIRDAIATSKLKDRLREFVQNEDPFEAAVDSGTDALEKQAAVLRIATDEMRAFLKAQQDINQGVGIGQMDIIGGLTMPELDSAATLMPGTAIADNLEDNLGRVNDASAEYANLFLTLSTSIGQSLGNAFQDVEDANQKVLLSILETVRSAVRLYLSMTLGREIATKGFAGIATFAALATLVEATFAAAASSIQGFAEGGIVLGEGQRRSGAVRSSDGRPIRRTNGDNMLVTAKVGEIFLNDDHREAIERMLGPNVWKALGIPGFAGGGIVSNSQYTFKKGSGGIAAPRPSTQEAINAELAGVTQRLAMTPIYASWTEGMRVGRRIEMTEASSSL